MLYCENKEAVDAVVFVVFKRVVIEAENMLFCSRLCKENHVFSWESVETEFMDF